MTKAFSINKAQGILQSWKRLRNNSKVYEFTALDNISFTVSKGEVLGIIGRNGSGKTTLLRTIAGIYQQDSGIIQIHGRIAPLLQICTGFQNELDAKENIIISLMFFENSLKAFE